MGNENQVQLTEEQYQRRIQRILPILERTVREKATVVVKELCRVPDEVCMVHLINVFLKEAIIQLDSKLPEGVLLEIAGFLIDQVIAQRKRIQENSDLPNPA